jgi:DNA polymerase
MTPRPLRAEAGSRPPAAPVPEPQAAPAPEAELDLAPGLSLEEVRQELGDCQRCKLGQARNHLVFGVGSPKARLMFIGEGPGADEDRQGEPFVGKAGQLLNRLLAKMGLSREDVYIANVVKCRPPGNRNPEAEEMAACLPFLIQQIQAIRPKIIVTLGAIATHALLQTKAPLNRLRGGWQQWRGIRVMPTFHPSYLLRVPQERIKTWEDMQKVLAVYHAGEQA